MSGEELAAYGIDYAKGLKNCLGDQAFYRKIMRMFLEDPCFSRAQAAHKCRDDQELFSQLHELKGTSGNAALIELYAATVPLVEALRPGGLRVTDEEIDPMFARIEAAYQHACEGITLFLAP